MIITLLAVVGAVAIGSWALAPGHGWSPASCLYEHEIAHAGGWASDHPDAIYTRKCGGLPMPPHKFPLEPGAKPVIYYIPGSQMWWHCGPRTQACSQIGGQNPVIYLPIQ